MLRPNPRPVNASLPIPRGSRIVLIERGHPSIAAGTRKAPLQNGPGVDFAFATGPLFNDIAVLPKFSICMGLAPIIHRVTLLPQAGILALLRDGYSGFLGDDWSVVAFQTSSHEPAVSRMLDRYTPIR